jgi:hypothetical protein
LDRAGSGAVGDAQDAAAAEDGHLDGVPAAGGCRKHFQPIGRRGDRLGGTSFAWLHKRCHPVAKPFCTKSCGLIIHYV